MSPLLVKAGLRHLALHRWQSFLSVLGVALGVAMVVGIDLANESARRSFESALVAVTGRATHAVAGGPFGVPEEAYRRLRLAAGVRDCAPVVEGDAWAGRAGPVRVLGVDPFAEGPFRGLTGPAGALDLAAFMSEPGSVLATRATAERLGLSPGERGELHVTGRARSILLAGYLEPVEELDRLGLENLLLADLSSAQELLGYEGRLSRIDLVLPAGDESALRRVREALPAGATLEPAAARARAQASLADGFRTNLRALSFLALVVGVFLIYNTMTFSVVQRRESIGVLRGLGVTRRELFAGVLAEAFGVGVLGTALGLGLGALLGQGLVGMVARTLNDFYFVLAVTRLELSAASLGKGVALGLLATVAAAAVPAWEAATVPPRTASLRSAAEDRLRRAAPKAAAAGLGLLLAAWVVLFLPGDVLLGFAALFLLVVGFSLCVPAVMLAVDPFARRLLGAAGGILGRLAVGGVTASMSRTVVAIAALSVSVAVVIGMGSMIRSFRLAVKEWLETHLPADAYAAPPSLVSGRPETTMEPEVARALAATPGLAASVRFRNVRVSGPSGSHWLVAADRHPSLRRAFPLKRGEPDAAWAGFERGEALVSEPLALRLGLEPGGSIVLPTDRGPVPFPVAAVFYDYASDQGTVLLARAAYEAHWADRGVSSMGFFAAPGVEPGELAARLGRAAGESQVIKVSSTAELRSASLAVFDRTFRVTSVLRLLAMVVSFIGVLSALMALQLERAREFAVLRANGMTPRQLWGLVTGQTGLMGLTAGLLALPLGWAITALLVHVVYRRSFHWTFEMRIDPAAVAQGLGLAVAAALLAGVYPAWRMANASPALALRRDA